MKKFNLILLTMVGAVPAAFLVYLMVMALTIKHIWDKKLLGGSVLGAGVIALIVAIWSPLYAIAFYHGPEKSEDEPVDAAEANEAVEEAAEESEVESEEFPEEDLDAFEGENSEFKPAETGTEFDLDDAENAEEFEATETSDFQLDQADELEDLDTFEDLEEEEEEAPKKKKKKK